jgi:putative intracellular protease/amidase
MQSSDVYVLVFDGFADWEPAYALAEIRRSANRRVVVAGFDRNQVVSMGGLRVLPDVALDEIAARQVGLLILPGGDMWQAGKYPEAALSKLLRQLDESKIPIAAICGATLGLARARLLNDRRHTSTVPGDLNAMPNYSGASRYVTEGAVSDRGVITASGLASVDFAREIFAMLEVFGKSDQKIWFEMYKTGQLPST